MKIINDVLIKVVEKTTKEFLKEISPIIVKTVDKLFNNLKSDVNKSLNEILNIKEIEKEDIKKEDE